MKKLFKDLRTTLIIFLIVFLAGLSLSIAQFNLKYEDKEYLQKRKNIGISVGAFVTNMVAIGTSITGIVGLTKLLPSESGNPIPGVMNFPVVVVSFLLLIPSLVLYGFGIDAVLKNSKK